MNRSNCRLFYLERRKDMVYIIYKVLEFYKIAIQDSSFRKSQVSIWFHTRISHDEQFVSWNFFSSVIIEIRDRRGKEFGEDDHQDSWWHLDNHEIERVNGCRGKWNKLKGAGRVDRGSPLPPCPKKNSHAVELACAFERRREKNEEEKEESEPVRVARLVIRPMY